MAIDRQDSHLRRGHRYAGVPIPMVPEHCVAVDTGPIRFVVESRALTDTIVREAIDDLPPDMVLLEDGGPTLHVCDRDDLEYLRFDCFEHEPHYHYIDQGAVTNTVVRIDELAVGDPVEFSLACVEHHLPDMLRHCGVGDLADEVAGRPERVGAAVAEVRALMVKARQPVG